MVPGSVSLLYSVRLPRPGVAQTRGRVWARYEPEMQDPVEDPPDVGRKGEFVLGACDTGLQWMAGVSAVTQVGHRREQGRSPVHQYPSAANSYRRRTNREHHRRGFRRDVQHSFSIWPFGRRLGAFAIAGEADGRLSAAGRLPDGG